MKKNYCIKEINQKKTMSKKHKRVFTTLNLRREHLLNLVSAVTGCLSISAFVSLVGISIGIVNMQ